MEKEISSVGIDSPVGRLRIWANNAQIERVTWECGPSLGADHPKLLHDAASQMEAYFNATLTAFDLPLALGRGQFQVGFQLALLKIPHGETRTYGELAAELGASAQAIGQACGANRLPIIVPCHRVLGATNLGGYSGAGGVEAKVSLLRHEGAAGLLI
ncbi:MAG: methylated-DNA--[protein]-cysteine S-methyltransferase [Pseudomonadota bacterium]